MNNRMNWFIGCTHFYHANIIRYCNRPFKDFNEMNCVILHNINTVVQESDTLWHMGDVAYGRDATLDNIEYILRKIRCKDIRLIRGNHDHDIMNNYRLKNLFTQRLNYFLGKIEDHRILLVHRPPDPNVARWETTLINREVALHKNLIWLHAHTHNNSQVGPRNMCVENNKYKPVSLDEILRRFKHEN